VSPPLFGTLADSAGYGAGWLLVSVLFAAAGAVAAAMHRARARVQAVGID
jgi:hypothetical protein